MITAHRDVLFVGQSDLPELSEMRRAGLEVGTSRSLPEALEALRAVPGSVVVVEGPLLEGRGGDRCGVLRDAGATAVVAVFTASDGWRADRALARGVDAAIALPAAPGAVAAATLRLVRAPSRALLPGAAGSRGASAEVPPPALAEAGEAPWIESVLGDAAVLHRGIENPERILDQVLLSFSRRSRAERCSILLYDRRRTCLRLRRSSGVRDVSRVEPIPAGQGLVGHVARTGLPLVVADVSKLPESVAAAQPEGGRPAVEGPERAYRTPSCLLLPLRGVDDVVGVVCLADKTSGEPFVEEDVPPLRFLADQAGQAVENAIKFRELQELAAVDELTGLANRRQFQRSIDREVQRARRYGRPLSLCLLDLDHFKQYNDRCGHQAGDQALATVGEILRTSLREVDVVARYGGEEFAVILPETAARPVGTASNPFPFLERLRRRIEDAPFPGEEKLPGGKLTVSGGVACFPDDAANGEDLIREADRALYVSKSRGRNTITYRGRALSE